MMYMEASWPLLEKGKPLSIYKASKVVLHSTVCGKGKIARALKVKA